MLSATKHLARWPRCFVALSMTSGGDSLGDKGERSRLVSMQQSA